MGVYCIKFTHAVGAMFKVGYSKDCSTRIRSLCTQNRWVLAECPKVFISALDLADAKAMTGHLLSLETRIHTRIRELTERPTNGIRRASRAAGDGRTELYVSDQSLGPLRAFMSAILKIRATGTLVQLEMGTLALKPPALIGFENGTLRGNHWRPSPQQINPFKDARWVSADTDDRSEESSLSSYSSYV